MIGVIRRPNWKKPVNPNDYFDPTTHIASEVDFIRFLETGTYTEDVIGYKVQLSNTVDYNNGLWVIADVNHNSTNTGQNNCYDLISQDCFHSVKFNESGNGNNWRKCLCRSWLNDTFYTGFNIDFKNHILNPKYKSQAAWYDDDYIILPSKTEVNGGTSFTDNEGPIYPIFTGNSGTDANNSRIKYRSGTSTAVVWWTRSRNGTASTSSWVCNGNGSMSAYGIQYDNYLAPILRVQ